MERTIIEKLKAAVHKPLDYSEYDSSYTINRVNCYAHAIGATSLHMGIRIGDICGKKEIMQSYNSDEEVESLFLQDMNTLGINCKKLYIRKQYLLNWLSKTKLSPNYVVVILFVDHNGDKSIRDFHFWRIDSQKGITDKRPRQRLSQIDQPKYSWPASELNHFVGVYLLKKKR